VQRWLDRRAGGVACLAAAVLLGIALSWPFHASAAPKSPSGGSAAPPPAGNGSPRPGSQGGAARGSDPLAAPAPPAPAAKELGASGQVDPISGLGIRNPVCDRPGQIRSRRTRLSCRLNGTPESTYPASNYGFDVFIDSGVDASGGIFAKGMVMLLNGIWLGLGFVLKLVLVLLGLAFGLNPFSDGETMREISVAIERVYRHITDPWLSTLVVCAGIWFAYKGLVRRELAAGVAGTLAGVALLIVGLWVVHSPRDSVGGVAKLTDQLALGVIAAPQSGSLARPTGSYAEAMSRTWSGLVEVPFAGLNFSDVGWALGPPPPEAVERADAKFCADVGALALLSILSRYGEEEASAACAGFARRRYGEPRRVIDLYLRSSPGSPARRELWKFFDKDEADKFKSKVAAQGGDGVLTRLSMLALFTLGLLGAILLLAWLAIRLFTQASIGFVLILVAPLALFFPLLGDSGRRAFKTWGLTLLGAIAAKVIYAAFLSVVLLGMGVLGRVGGAMGFLLSCGFAWSVFLRRAELVGWLSIGDAEPAPGRNPLGQIAAFTAARQVGQTLGGATRGVARATRGWAGDRLADGGEATRQAAGGSLRNSARALAEQRHGEARRTVAEFEVRHGSPGRQAPPSSPTPVRPAGAEAPQSARQPVPPSSHGSGATVPQPERRRYEQARELLAAAQRNERAGGERFSSRQLDRFAEEDRALLRESADPADHAHRIGLQRAQFEALRGSERERAEASIEAATRRDRRRLEVATEVPGRVVGRGRQAAERLSQRDGEGGAERREHLRRLRRERRAGATPRRGLSRGA